MSPPLMIKILNKPAIEGNSFNLINSTYEKPTANIIINGERMKAFSPGSRTRSGSLLSSLLFSVVFKILSWAVWQEK